MPDCGALLEKINAMIKKADDQLEEALRIAGYQEAGYTVEQLDKLETAVVKYLNEQKAIVDKKMANATSLVLARDDILKAITRNVEISGTFADEFFGWLNETAAKLADSYIKVYDKDLAFDLFCDRTVAFMEDWSPKLAVLIKETTHDALSSIFESALSSGSDIDWVRDQLQDAYQFSRERARAIALTETLRTHSYAADDAMRQSPSVDRKMWRHSGGRLNDARKHHMVLDGVTIGKTEKFVIDAPDGTYECDFPRDIMLPAGETVNCHCIHEAVVSDTAIGLTLEERQKLMEEARQADNRAYAGCHL